MVMGALASVLDPVEALSLDGLADSFRLLTDRGHRLGRVTVAGHS